MAVEVVNSVDGRETIAYDTATKWVIDDERQLHVVGAGGNLASYATGHWASVHQISKQEDTAA